MIKESLSAAIKTIHCWCTVCRLLVPVHGWWSEMIYV